MSHQFLVGKAGGLIRKSLCQIQCLPDLVGNWFIQVKPTTPAEVRENRPAYLCFEVLLKSALCPQFVPQQSIGRMLSIGLVNNLARQGNNETLRLGLAADL